MLLQLGSERSWYAMPHPSASHAIMLLWKILYSPSPDFVIRGRLLILRFSTVGCRENAGHKDDRQQNWRLKGVTSLMLDGYIILMPRPCHLLGCSVFSQSKHWSQDRHYSWDFASFIQAFTVKMGAGKKPTNIFRISLGDDPKEVNNWRLWFGKSHNLCI